MTQKTDYVRRLGDNVLVLSQRLTEWCGKGPALEEDMALINVSLDLIGQARLWLSYAAELEGQGRNEDQLAFLRDAHQFHNLLLVELPNGSYADTLARQFLFDVWHYFLLEGLCQSSDARIAEIAQKCFKEVTYHVRRSTDLMIRLGDGTEDSHRRMQAAIDALWMYTGELFVADALDQAMQEQGVATALGEVQQKWTQHVTDVLLEATLKVPPAGLWMQSGGKAGRHTEHLGYLLAEMQFLQRAYPGAQW
ncbi:phenylacetate-CoA oxygenase subunit PaaC [Herbaspirillum seropedicae]|uniref:Phenylacetic acid degradation protein n=1 Tax=Herbaspirillum seropedicae (strain SmR1) TaxID=757424 RepID=D8ITG7_HERSS|nr:1,2-phenylacetyl-CoA epoxidase subunit PaaC [Herbaspirillum seropedicae]ADJ65597.1 phenylacetic acid degradation protein [Herbaspirillum seropedicae SmR1]AKN67417.1 phenylacetic acid degradation protein [Herbaspirillum seropedicae]AON56473.1 phenylacetic acid degradation protein [Herbaspirillum seropedicae]NQE32008.1 phenylacetic acid degradation protein [Herbaspirillum seropedicae]UMU23425.1 phenylacetate-CoA oxygenase subunit PaaC [Herbaspirillum seropedicae]